MKGIADKLALNQKVGGVSGTIAVQTQLDCGGSNQSDCIATATYKTMNIGEQGGGGAAGLTTANFETRVSSNDSFEYWDASGNRNISSGDADLITNNVKSGVNILGTDGPTDPLNCASIAVGGTWIMVPGDLNYGTNDFCVMKYEAKCSEANGQDCSASMSTESPSSTAANTPWVSIDQQDAKTECASLGKGFHLISNDEWMTIGVNLVGVGSNWSNGAVGNAQLIRGHSDNDPAQACAASSDDSLNVVETDCTNQASANDDFIEQRTHTLSNGEVIWDLAGNVWESTSYFNDEEKPTPLGDAWDEFTDISGTSTMLLTDLLPQIAIDNNWNSTESIGMYYPGLDSSGGALRRGGRWDVPSSGGVFATRLNNPPTNTSPNIGFRCAVAVP